MLIHLPNAHGPAKNDQHRLVVEFRKPRPLVETMDGRRDSSERGPLKNAAGRRAFGVLQNFKFGFGNRQVRTLLVVMQTGKKILYEMGLGDN